MLSLKQTNVFEKKAQTSVVNGGHVHMSKGNGGMAWRGEGSRCCGVGSSHLAASQLLSSSSVAVSTSQDFEDKAAITAFLSKPMAQSLSILRV